LKTWIAHDVPLVKTGYQSISVRPHESDHPSGTGGLPDDHEEVASRTKRDRFRSIYIKHLPAHLLHLAEQHEDTDFGAGVMQSTHGAHAPSL
jgi:hypothetical protein